MTNFLVPQAQNLKSQFLNMSPSLPSYYSNHLQNRFRIWPLLTTSIAITLVPPSILSHLDYWNSLSASSLSALQSILNTAAKVIDLFKMLVLHFHSSAQNPQMTSPVRQFNNLKCSAPHSPYMIQAPGNFWPHLSFLVPLFTRLLSLWPPCRSSDVPGKLSSQGFCPCCSPTDIVLPSDSPALTSLLL